MTTMKKNVTTLIIIALIFLFPSCSTILGVKSPNKITKEVAYNYLIKHNIDTSNVLFLKNNYFDTLRSLPFKPGWEPGLRPIQCKIFSKNGELIFQYSSCEGSLKRTELYEQFPPKNITPIDSTYSLSDEIRMIDNFPSLNDEKKYITIVYWATFTGLPGRKLIEKMEKNLEEQNINTVIYKLNTDIIENK